MKGRQGSGSAGADTFQYLNNWFIRTSVNQLTTILTGQGWTRLGGFKLGCGVSVAMVTRKVRAASEPSWGTSVSSRGR